MALTVDDTTTPAPTFQWGSGGARLTPDEIAARRKVADALMAQGTDSSPFPVGTRGAGLVTQGLARMAKGIVGGWEAHNADQAAQANAADSRQMIATLLGGGGAAPAAAPAAATVAPAATTATPSTPAAATVAPNAPNAPLDPETTGYINAAAAKYGVDPAYLTRTAMLESSGNPNAVNSKSGAAGLFQFMPKTAKEYELDNPLDPEDSAMAAAELAKDNRDTLASALGRAPTNAELYLAHQQGANGAAKLLANPNAPAVSVVGRDAVVSNGGNEGMTAGQFANLWLNKYGAVPGAPAPVASNGPISTGAPVQVASNGPVAPVGPGASAAQPAAPSPAVAKVASAMPAGAPVSLAAPSPAAPAAAPSPAPSPAVAKVASALPTPAAAPAATTPGTARVQAALQAYTSPYADAQTKQVAGMVLQQAMKPQVGAPYVDPNLGVVQKGADGTIKVLRPPRAGEAYTDANGNLMQVGPDGTLHAVIKADSDPTSVKEYQYYKNNFQPTAQQPTPMDYGTWSTAKARAGAVNINQPINVDTKPSQTYSNAMAGAIAKMHAGLANNVENAQASARDIAAMQGAIDAIQKNGGSTGGMGQQQLLDLQKTINTGAAALGFSKPFSEADISDKEFLQKFNRQLAGNMAKGAMGSRVTNFEMQNYLKANPGLEMSPTGNQRLLGIQAQIEQRNIAVGNAIRQATVEAMAKHQDVDPATVQGIITNYDNTHHIKDPVTGQDLTQSYVLPEFQQGGTNAALAAGHANNIGKIRRYNPATGALE